MSRANQSVVFDLKFARVDSQGRRVCTTCNKTKPSWPASNIVDHYMRHHKAQYQTIQQHKKKRKRSDEDNSDTVTLNATTYPTTPTSTSSANRILHQESPDRSPSTISTVPSIFAKANANALLDKCTLAFTMNSMSHNTIREPYFKDFMKACASAYDRMKIPTRAALRNNVIRMAKKTKQTVLSRISSSSYPAVTIAIDGWTNKTTKDKVYNNMCIHNTRAYYMGTIVNDEKSNTAENLASFVQPFVASLLQQNIRVVAIAADNEPVNGAVIRKIAETYPWIIHIPCAAHTIQLVVNRFLQSSIVQPIIDRIQSIIEQFQHSKHARQELKKQCTSQNKNTGYKLKRIVPTRWNTALFAIERQLSIKDQISYTMTLQNMDNIPDNAFWTQAQHLVLFLKPFQIATDTVQQDAVTLSAVAQAHLTLHQCIHSGVVNNSPFAPALMDCLNNLDDHWNKHINNNAVAAVQYLCALDGNPAKSSVMEWIIEWGTKYVKHFNLSSSTNERDISALIQQQLLSFHSKTAPFDNRDKLIDRLKQSTVIDFNPRDFWTYYLGDQLELCHVALALLSICPSEASVERSFSQQALIHRDRRNRLLSDAVDAEMTIKINTPLLAQQHIELISDDELSSDNEGQEI